MTRSIKKAAGGIFTGLGMVSLLLFFVAALRIEMTLVPLFAWGELLFAGLGWLGLYFPIYLIVSGLLLSIDKLKMHLLFRLSVGFVPVMFLGTSLRLMFDPSWQISPFPVALAKALTLEGAVVVCAALALLAFIAIVQMPDFFLKKPSKRLRKETLKKETLKKDASETFALLQKLSSEKSVGPEASDVISNDEVLGESINAGVSERVADLDELDDDQDLAEQGLSIGPSAVAEFSQGVKGRLENVLPRKNDLPDIDAPLHKTEKRRLWEEGEDLQFPQDEYDEILHKPSNGGQTIATQSSASRIANQALGILKSITASQTGYAVSPHAQAATALLERELDETQADSAADADFGSNLSSDYVPHRQMFFSPELDLEEEDTALEVYFSKDGSISDYPPQGRAQWTTSVDDQDFDVELAQSSQLEAELSIAPETSNEPSAQTTAQIPIVGLAIVEVPMFEEDELLHIESANLEDNHVAAQDYQQLDIPDSTLAMELKPAEQSAVNTDLLPPLSVSPREKEIRGAYYVPIEGILEPAKNQEYWRIDERTTAAAVTLKATLQEFGIEAEVTGIRKGPVITMFEILPAPGVKLARIVNLADNIALRLAASSVRIVAPIPGKHAVGIEIPNKDRAVVSFGELLLSEGFTSSKVAIPVALGKDITGEAQIVDLTKTPHLLIAGATGSGKSVCVNALICSILYRCSPAEVNLILIDPKIVELKFYNDIPHLLTPVITDPKKAFQALQWCIFEMERRYSLLDAMQVRDIKSFNAKIINRKIATPKLPYLVVVIDEFADLMATSGKELEGTLARLAAMSRAVGIHLVLATQRPSTDVITGLIKANIPSRIAFMVSSKIDSRIIIDSMGAEKLLGKGDMLFASAWDPFPFRMQGALLSEEEVERVVAHVKTLGKPDYIDDEIFFEDDEIDPLDSDYGGDEDTLMKQAIEIVISAKKASASYLQRRLKIGYNRAARMVEQMEEMGIVGPGQGSKPREILRMF